jgi:hypothetical protein
MAASHNDEATEDCFQPGTYRTRTSVAATPPYLHPTGKQKASRFCTESVFGRALLASRSFFSKHDALRLPRNIPIERGRHMACHKAFQDFRFLTVRPEIRTSWAM